MVRLVSDHALGAQTLSQYQPPAERTLKEVGLRTRAGYHLMCSFRLQIASDLERRKLGESKKPLDDNSATHIIRNALGGCTGGMEKQYERLQESLQLPPGMARNYRDDITVIVVHFNEQFLTANDSDQSSAVSR